MMRLSLSVLVLALVAWSSVLQASSSARPVIVKSPSDPREFRYITLENEIRVALVNHPGTETAAVAVGVNVGHYQNPDEWPGLAHLLEHMLFLGSEPYPEPDAFDKYTAEHGGYNNAWTSETDTVYYLTIAKAYLFQAVERLSLFFTAPLISPEYLEWERHAVDSEYQINRQEDLYRIGAVEKKTVNPEHPASRFSIGNLNTLSDHSGLSAHEALLSLHRTWYTPHNLSIAIVSDEPLDELERKTRALFAGIPARQSPSRVILPPLYTEQELGVRIDIQVKKQLRNLQLEFPLPVDKDYLKYKPTAYLAHLLGYEGKGSLYSLLKEKGWIDGLNTWGSDDTQTASFKVEAELTELGYQHIDEITGQVFAFLKLIQNRGISQKIYKELHTQQELQFMFAEPADPEDTAVGLVSHMPIMPPEDLIQGHIRIPAFNPNKIRQLFSYLTPDNMRMRVVNNIPPPGSESELRTEPGTGTSYSVRKLTSAQKKSYHRAVLSPNLSLPASNPFIPDNLSLVDEPESKKPELEVAEDGFNSWYYHDNSFGVPKTKMILGFGKSTFLPTPESFIMFQLFLQQFRDSYNETRYQAELAGIRYGLTWDESGFVVEIFGYNDSMPAFVQSLLTHMKTLRVNPERLTLHKSQLEGHLQDVALQGPLQHLSSALGNILYRYEYTVEQKLQALAGITPKQLQDYIATLFVDTALTVLTSGNISRQKAGELVANIEQIVSPSDSVRVTRLMPYQVPEVPEQPVCHVSYAHEDSAISVITQASSRDLPTRAAFRLLGSQLSTPFYSQLRTEEQLGYQVFALAHDYRVPTLVFDIQSSEFSPDHLDRRITAFLEKHRKTIEELTEEQLQSHKDGLISALKEKATRLSEQARSFWWDISRGYTRFNQNAQLIDAINKVGIADIQDLYNRLLKREHQIRLYGYNQNARPDNLPPACNSPAFTTQFEEFENNSFYDASELYGDDDDQE